MKAVCEAVVHAAVVGPVFLLVGALDLAGRVVETASAAVGRFAGETKPPSAGTRRLKVA